MILCKTKFLLALFGAWAMCAASGNVVADSTVRSGYLGVSAGSASPKATHFASAQSWNYDAGYRFENVSSEVTYSYFGRFRHDNSADTDVRVWGITLAALPRYEVNSWLELEGLLGAQRWQANSQLLGKHFGRDDGTGATFGAGVWINIRGALIKEGAAISLRWQRYNNISGTDISQYALGVQYVFH